MATVVFKPNKKGVGQIAVSPQAHKAVRDWATQKAMPYAISISPVDSGEYAGSFQVIDTVVMHAGRWRAAALLENTADHAAAVEFGNAATNGRGHHVLQRTLEHFNRLRKGNDG